MTHTTHYQQTVRALFDEILNVRKPVACPVGDVACDPHTFVKGTGVVVPWDVLGDPRHSVEVCASCADISE